MKKYIFIWIALVLGYSTQIFAQSLETPEPSLYPIFYLLFDDGTTVPPDDSELLQQLTVFGENSCALKFNGKVVCWGRNDAGQLGNFTTYNPIAPVDVLDIDTAQTIVANQALLGNGQVWSWGDRFFDDPIGLNLVTPPTPLTGLSNVIAVSAKPHRHQCAVVDDGTVNCWGYNAFGQLGNGTVVDSDTPVSANGINSATAVSVGDTHSCALLIDASIKCWGYNASGQLGDGSTNRKTEPVTVSGINDAVSISSGKNFNCASLTSGQVKCWGQNVFGQLGDGTKINALNPVQVQQLSNAGTVSLGNHHACVLLMDGLVSCWGKNNLGQLGNNSKMQSSVPVSVSRISAVTILASGEEHNCALDERNLVNCWGSNSAGQLGDRTNEDSSVPVLVDFSPVSVNNLAAELTESVDQAIESKDAAMAGTFYSFLDHDNSTYTRNADVWTGNLTQNATCISVYSSTETLGFPDNIKGATLITPQHILTTTSSFSPISVGDVVRFVDLGNTVHERTVTHLRNVPDVNGSSSTIRLARFDSPIGAQVSTCKLSPADIEAYLKPHYALPVLTSSLVQEASLTTLGSIVGNLIYPSSVRTLKRWEFTAGRNPGAGIFFIVNDELMMFSIYDTIGDPNLGLHLTDINRLIGVLDSEAGDITGYQALTVDLSMFDKL